MDNRWIWQKVGYPDFYFDYHELHSFVERISFKQGELSSVTKTLDADNLNSWRNDVLIDEVINTSAIEGEILNRDSVRASVALKLGLFNLADTKTDIKNDYLVDLLIDANTNYNKELSLERIFGWHNALFPTGYSGMNKINVAQLRGEEEMKVVSGYEGKETIRYVAPPREILDNEIAKFIEWFNRTEASLIKAAIAHLWFNVIHPLDDGNGRISRAIADLVLAKIEKSSMSKLFSMSSAINNRKKDYYDVLDRTTGYYRKDEDELDITDWIKWFLITLEQSLDDSLRKLEFIKQKTKFWDKYRKNELNNRQQKFINKILDKGIENFEGNITRDKYIKLSGGSKATATRDIKVLVDLGCIVQKEGTIGRSTSYLLVIPE